MSSPVPSIPWNSTAGQRKKPVLLQACTHQITLLWDRKISPPRTPPQNQASHRNIPGHFNGKHLVQSIIAPVHLSASSYMSYNHPRPGTAHTGCPLPYHMQGPVRKLQSLQQAVVLFLHFHPSICIWKLFVFDRIQLQHLVPVWMISAAVPFFQEMLILLSAYLPIPSCCFSSCVFDFVCCLPVLPPAVWTAQRSPTNILTVC